jgi:hypothetical protein
MLVIGVPQTIGSSLALRPPRLSLWALALAWKIPSPFLVVV